MVWAATQLWIILKVCIEFVGIAERALKLIFLIRKFFGGKESVYDTQLYLTAEQARDYIAEDSKWGQYKKGRNMLVLATEALEESALNGEVEIWGRPEGLSQYKKLDNFYWETASIYSWDDQGRDRTGGRTGRKSRTWDDPSLPRQVPVFVGLRVETRQVKKKWRRAFPWEKIDTKEAMRRESESRIVETPTPDTEDYQTQ